MSPSPGGVVGSASPTDFQCLHIAEKDKDGDGDEDGDRDGDAQGEQTTPNTFFLVLCPLAPSKDISRLLRTKREGPA